MKQKSDWKRITLRKTSFKKEIKKYWPVINDFTDGQLWRFQIEMHRQLWNPSNI